MIVSHPESEYAFPITIQYENKNEPRHPVWAVSGVHSEVVTVWYPSVERPHEEHVMPPHWEYVR